MGKSCNPNGNLHASDGNVSEGAMYTASRQSINTYQKPATWLKVRDFGVPCIGRLRNTAEVRFEYGKTNNSRLESCHVGGLRVASKCRVRFPFWAFQNSDVSVLVIRGHVFFWLYVWTSLAQACVSSQPDSIGRHYPSGTRIKL
jgi:hypothetical protein